MFALNRRNVNDLWRDGLAILRSKGVGQNSRNGRVLVLPEPMVSVYQRPQERVLFGRSAANPFFHCMEPLWMLAGREDTAFLDCYVKDFGERYGDGPKAARYVHGAYGHRWRVAFGTDQLDEVVKKLRLNPDDRQAVIQMWDCDGSDDLVGGWKDRPCNTHIYLRVRSRDTGAQVWSGEARIPLVDPLSHTVIGSAPDKMELLKEQVLDLTVCCRSNDIVWGAYGANAVHFSFLQEYLAGRIGVGIGTMYQFSNNWHGYLQEIDKYPVSEDSSDLYASGDVTPLPVGDQWSKWDEDLALFMNWHDHLWTLDDKSMSIDVPEGFRNQWFYTVAGQVALTNWLWRKGRRQEALERVDFIEAPDWHQACREWLVRRNK